MAIIKPFIASRRFDSTAGAGIGTGATYSIAATAFTTDTGAAATAFPVPTYYDLYINGMIREGNTSTITITAITIELLESGTQNNHPICYTSRLPH